MVRWKISKFIMGFSERQLSFDVQPFFIILFATAVSAAANFFVQFLLARTLGPIQFGAFSSALALVTLLAQLAAFGLGGWWLRVFAEEGNAAQRWIKSSLRFSVLSSFSVVMLLIIWAQFGPHDSLTGLLVIMLSGVVLSQVINDLVIARFQLESRHMGVAAWQLVSHPLRFIGLLFIVSYVSLPTPLYVASLYLGISVLIFSIGIFYLTEFYNGKFRLAGHQDLSHFSKTNPFWEEPSLRDIFIRSSPFGLGGFFFLVYHQTDIILLRYLVNEEAVGFYGGSVVFMAAAYILPSVLYQKFLSPAIHRWAYEERDRIEAFIIVLGIPIFLFGLLLTLVFWHGAEYFIPLVLGEDYRPSIPLLMFMSLAIPFRYLASHLGSVLYTRDLVWTNLKFMGFTALLNVFLNLLLIPQYGGRGAAVATVVSYVFLAILFAAAVRKEFWVESRVSGF